MKKGMLMRFLLWVFGLSVVVEGVCIWAFYRGDLAITQGSMMLLMYMPLISVLLCGRGLKGLGFKVTLKGNVRYLLFSWFGPLLLSLAGAALYFGIFRNQFDLSGAILGETLLQNLTDQGLDYKTYVLMSVIACATYAPLANLFLAVGEEAGWRGFLYPELKQALGKRQGRIIGGLIWGIWHWPLIAFTGYEYGVKYFGFPITGLAMFALFCIAMGVLCDEVYEKTGCIWFPAVLHGSINAAGTLGLAVLSPGFDGYRLLGPAPNGLLAGLPLLLLGGWLLFRKEKE